MREQRTPIRRHAFIFAVYHATRGSRLRWKRGRELPRLYAFDAAGVGPEELAGSFREALASRKGCCAGAPLSNGSADLMRFPAAGLWNPDYAYEIVAPDKTVRNHTTDKTHPVAAGSC